MSKAFGPSQCLPKPVCFHERVSVMNAVLVDWNMCKTGSRFWNCEAADGWQALTTMDAPNTVPSALRSEVKQGFRCQKLSAPHSVYQNLSVFMNVFQL